jgi:hypothetical protein
MRPVLLIIFTLFIIKANAQFETFNDTANHYSIIYPTAWKYEIGDPVYRGIAFSASRVPVGKGDYARDNFNINIIKTPRKDLEKSFADLVRYLSDDSTSNFKVIEKGDTLLNGRKFKWLIETHKYPHSPTQMLNYDFLTVKEGKTYILTFTTFSNYFDTVKPLFDKIAGSFILH